MRSAAMIFLDERPDHLGTSRHRPSWRAALTPIRNQPVPGDRGVIHDAGDMALELLEVFDFWSLGDWRSGEGGK